MQPIDDDPDGVEMLEMTIILLDKPDDLDAMERSTAIVDRILRRDPDHVIALFRGGVAYHLLGRQVMGLDMLGRSTRSMVRPPSKAKIHSGVICSSLAAPCQPEGSIWPTPIAYVPRWRA